METQEQKQASAIKRAEELLEMYKEIGASGFFGVSLIPQVIDRAKKAFESGTAEEKIEAMEELNNLE